MVQGMAELREYREQGGGDEGTVLGLFADDVRSSGVLERSAVYAAVC